MRQHPQFFEFCQFFRQLSGNSVREHNRYTGSQPDDFNLFKFAENADNLNQSLIGQHHGVAAGEQNLFDLRMRLERSDHILKLPVGDIVQLRV